MLEEGAIDCPDQDSVERENVTDRYVVHPVPRDGWEPVTGQDGQPILLKSTKGNDMAEWPKALRVREYPNAAARAEPRSSASIPVRPALDMDERARETGG
jgi:hypothetical protein